MGLPMVLVVIHGECSLQSTKKLPDAKGRAVSVFSRELRGLSLRNENRVNNVGFNFAGALRQVISSRAAQCVSRVETD